MAPATDLPHPYHRAPGDPATGSIGGADLQAARRAAARMLLLDVRPLEERRLARLRDDRHIPLAELAGRVAELPRDRPIVVYDHFGGGGAQAAGVLTRAGFPDVRSLDGGVDSYARDVEPEIGRYSVDAPGYVLKQLPRAASGCLAYLLGDPVARQAVLIDPGAEPDGYLHLLREEHWDLRAILETHTHADHLAGHAPLHRATGAPILLGRRSPAQFPHRSLSEGEAVRFGSEEITVLETPGHTPDHLTLRFRSVIFTGDTLLVGGCGRTDLGAGSPDDLYDSLEGKLLKLPDATEVLPAHYGKRHGLVERYGSTIGVERATNDALRQPDRGAFLTYMTEGWPPKPADFDRIVAANLGPFPE